MIARGRELFQQVLADPTRLPVDGEFEALLWIGERAAQRRAPLR